MPPDNTRGDHGDLQVERQGSQLCLVCPTCLARVKKPSTWHTQPRQSASNHGFSQAAKHDVHRSQKSTKSRLKSFCTRFGSLVFLMLFLAAFSASGAVLFRAIEAPNEQRVTIQLNIARVALMTQAYDLAQHLEYEDYIATINRSLDGYDNVAGDALKHGITAGQVESRWSFRSALFYCVTIFTTIGYGNVCPTTSLGRAVTIVYGLVAIPLFLVIIGKVGRYLAMGLNLCCLAQRNVCLLGFAYFFGRNETDDGRDEQRRPLLSPSMDSAALSLESSDELHVGPMVAIVVAVVFMLVGTMMYLLWEPWTFLEAFYFVFISLSTIGFGDFVPTRPTYFIMSSLYLFIGLALISMVINVWIQFYTSAYARAHDTLAQSKLCSICQK